MNCSNESDVVLDAKLQRNTSTFQRNAAKAAEAQRSRMAFLFADFAIVATLR